MNERIRELADQAGITTNLDTDYFEKDINKWVDYFAEKFAELIVRECIDICNEEKADYTKHKKFAYGEEKDIYNEGEAACDTIKRIMKKRFGVTDER